MELIDVSPAAKISSTVDDNQTPPKLLSMIIEGLPALQQSKYTDEAEILLKQYTDRWQKIVSFDSYCRVGLSAASYVHPEAIDADRLVETAIYYAFFFLIDDILVDSPDEFLMGQYGIDPNVCESPRRILEYLDYLGAVFSQEVAPQNSAIELILWEVGHKLWQMSNPEWFSVLVAGSLECLHSIAESHVEISAGDNSSVEDLELYTTMRIGNMGATFIQLMTEFTSNAYLPCEIRSHPYMQKLKTATSIHLGFANDIYSYHKESSLEGNPRNVITVLMKSEGLPRVQAMHAAIQLVNQYARTILDMEPEAWNSALQQHLKNIKALIAGNIYYGCFDKRYRQPDSVFPEQRDTTASWKACPPVGA